MVAPIPKGLLIHEVTYRAKQASEWGDSADPVTIEHVRVESKNTLARNSTGSTVTSDTLLFWDSVHSTPCAFVEDSEVTFNGRQMIVVSVQEFYDQSKLHHKEVRLA
jgi:hypothetical protein